MASARHINLVQLACRLAARRNHTISFEAAEQMIQDVLDEIQTAVVAGEAVVLPNFGIFERRDRAARMGRNPQTGEPIPIAETKAPAFKAAKKFKEQVAAAAKEV